jgi:hypothetical protein
MVCLGLQDIRCKNPPEAVNYIDMYSLAVAETKRLEIKLRKISAACKK